MEAVVKWKFRTVKPGKKHHTIDGYISYVEKQVEERRNNSGVFTVNEKAVIGLNDKIDINEDVLTISHETKNESEQNTDGYKRKEFCYSSFCRSFYVPENVIADKINASYKDGVLTVELPKNKEEKHKLSRQVSIS